MYKYITKNIYKSLTLIYSINDFLNKGILIDNINVFKNVDEKQ